MDTDKKYYLDEFNKNVEWLRNTVSEDDIYEFAEQTLMAADYFIYKWREWVDIEEEATKDKLTNSWLNNVVGLRMLRDSGYQGPLDLNMKMPGED